MEKDFDIEQCIRNKEFYYTIKEMLMCYICKKFAQNAVQCGDCDKLYCQKCILLKNMKCISCFKSKIVSPKSIVSNLIEKVNLCCPKCSDSVDTESAEFHVTNCKKGFKKENNWKNGWCLVCKKSANSCICTGKNGEKNWKDGWCTLCKNSVGNCICEGHIRENNWKDGWCIKCKKSVKTCICSGHSREHHWKDGWCLTCNKGVGNCICKN